jgi:hypothetical protein
VSAVVGSMWLAPLMTAMMDLAGETAKYGLEKASGHVWSAEPVEKNVGTWGLRPGQPMPGAGCMGAAALMPFARAMLELQTVAPPPCEWPAMPMLSKSTIAPHTVLACERTFSIAASCTFASPTHPQTSHSGVATTTKPLLTKQWMRPVYGGAGHGPPSAGAVAERD